MASSTKKSKFCDDGFLSISKKPLEIIDFKFGDIIDYCAVLDAAHNTDNNYRHEIKKGQELQRERFVTGIQHKYGDPGQYVVKSKVKAEMKKREAYEVACWISHENKVTKILFCMHCTH